MNSFRKQLPFIVLFIGAAFTVFPSFGGDQYPLHATELGEACPIYEAEILGKIFNASRRLSSHGQLQTYSAISYRSNGEFFAISIWGDKKGSFFAQGAVGKIEVDVYNEKDITYSIGSTPQVNISEKNFQLIVDMQIRAVNAATSLDYERLTGDFVNFDWVCILTDDVSAAGSRIVIGESVVNLVLKSYLEVIIADEKDVQLADYKLRFDKSFDIIEKKGGYVSGEYSEADIQAYRKAVSQKIRGR